MNATQVFKPNNKLFNDYAAFLEKFKAKKTTDDCYTPPAVYDAVVEYVNAEVTALEGRRIVRPFYPGGDYEAFDYQPGDIVIDNPPFSIMARICKFLDDHGVDFFLFGPHLTLGGLAKDRFTAVVCCAEVTYANGAVVRTSFVTNCWPGNPAVVVAGKLGRRITAIVEAAKKAAKPSLPRYTYPDGVVSSASLGKIAHAGLDMVIHRHEAAFIRALDSQRQAGRAIFGGGWLLSREAAAREAARAVVREAVTFELSDRELALQSELGNASAI